MIKLETYTFLYKLDVSYASEHTFPKVTVKFFVVTQYLRLDRFGTSLYNNIVLCKNLINLHLSFPLTGSSVFDVVIWRTLQMFNKLIVTKIL